MQKYRLISFLFVHILILLHVLWFKNSTVGSFDFQEFFDRFIGMGRNYLSYCEGGFRERIIGTHQITMTKPGYRPD